MHRLKSYGTFVPTYGHKGYLVELFDKGSIRYLIWEPKANMATLEAQSKAEAERVIEADIAEKQALLDARQRHEQLSILQLAKGVA
jgi:hypothetical protein